MNQKLAWGTFAGGLSTFMMSLAELLANHNTWSEMGAPKEIAHVMVMSASLIITLVGALGANLPRTPDSRLEDKVSPEKLEELRNVK